MRPSSPKLPLNLPQAFLRNCRRHFFGRKLTDSTGAAVTGGSLLVKSFALAKLLERDVLDDDERTVGVLVPPSVPGAIVNAALSLLRRVPVNLNYTLSAEALTHCLKVAGIRRVLTSRRVVERLPFAIDANWVFLEDYREKVGLLDKLRALLEASLVPYAWLDRTFGLDRIAPNDLFTIIFTSGSTGIPKGVMLSYENVRTNIAAMNEVSRLKPTDVFLGVLPLFHAFGYTCTLWAPLVLNVGASYHFNPLETNAVAKLCRDNKVTFLIGTPTLLRNYAKRCAAEDMASIEIILSGAEKLPKSLADVFEQKLHVRPVEGYGATELSPLASVNVPASRAVDSNRLVLKEGTVGLPIPGVEARIVHLETGEVLGIDDEGMLQMRGPNVMLGYLGDRSATERVLRDGWYSTGDVARIDRDGFITLTGRLSRFSKIGGEMVPHLAVEDALAEVTQVPDDEPSIAVTSVPDAAKGERLVVFHLPNVRVTEETVRLLSARGLPALWIPSPSSFACVDALPLLGTGKVDLMALRKMAEERFARDA